MYCYKCGKVIPDGTRFCHFCGAQQDVEDNPFSAGPSPNPEVSSRYAAGPSSNPEASPRNTAGPAVQPQNPMQGTAAMSVPRTAKPERVFLGILGMLLGLVAALGVALACERLPVGIQGLCMGLAVFAGYRMFGGRLGITGTVLCTVAMIASICFFVIFYWVAAVNWALAHVPNAYSHPDFAPVLYQVHGAFSQGFAFLRIMLHKGLAADFYLYFAQAIVFALLGGALLAVPDLLALHRHPEEMPRLFPGLIFIAVVLLIVICFSSFTGEAPVDSPAYRAALQLLNGLS